MPSINENDAQGILVNPFNVVVFADYVFLKRTHLGPKEDWVLLNAHIIDDIGAKIWLEELLDALSQTREEYDGHDALNPTLTINISNRLQGDHPPLVTRDQWVQANAKLIDELGSSAWLWRLLDTLETGGVKA